MWVLPPGIIFLIILQRRFWKLVVLISSFHNISKGLLKFLMPQMKHPDFYLPPAKMCPFHNFSQLRKREPHHYTSSLSATDFLAVLGMLNRSICFPLRAFAHDVVSIRNLLGTNIQELIPSLCIFQSSAQMLYSKGVFLDHVSEHPTHHQWSLFFHSISYLTCICWLFCVWPP